MKKTYSLFTLALALLTTVAFGQRRYIDPVFARSDVKVTSDITYATNIDFLISNLSASEQKIGQDVVDLKTRVATGQPIPMKYYNPADTNTALKVTDLKFDVYEPDPSVDSETDRAVVIFVHTGNFLPPGINGSPVGSRKDSSAIELCTQWAERGYVAVSVSYRLGWNPIAPTVFERRGTLLNAVYRAIHDVKQCVRTLRDDANGGNNYGIDPDNIVLYGEGTGAYVVNAYVTLDKYSEMELPKFLNPLKQKSFIDTTDVGRIDGSGGTFNLYGKSATSADVVMSVAAGGALADTSWLEKGDAAMLSIHCVRDPFAPFGEGTVIVPTTNEDVVDVQGGNLYIQKAADLGNNDKFKDISGNDPYTAAARANYGTTVEYIFPSPRNEITISATPEGLYPVLLPLGESRLNNQASPWQFWDPNSAVAQQKDQQGISNHQKSLASNPDMSGTKARTYMDTIQGYICPRMAVEMGYYTSAQLSVKEASLNHLFDVFPNPASDRLFIVNRSENNQMKHYQVLNTNGAVVMEGPIESSSYIDLNEVSNGVYFLHIETENGMVNKRILVH
jgi:hypothetical protein